MVKSNEIEAHVTRTWEYSRESCPLWFAKWVLDNDPTQINHFWVNRLLENSYVKPSFFEQPKFDAPFIIDYCRADIKWLAKTFPVAFRARAQQIFCFHASNDNALWIWRNFEITMSPSLFLNVFCRRKLREQAVEVAKDVEPMDAFHKLRDRGWLDEAYVYLLQLPYNEDRFYLACSHGQWDVAQQYLADNKLELIDSWFRHLLAAPDWYSTIFDKIICHRIGELLFLMTKGKCKAIPRAYFRRLGQRRGHWLYESKSNPPVSEEVYESIMQANNKKSARSG